MAGKSSGSRRFFLLTLLLVLVAGGVVAWVERKPLLAWYYLRQLAGADEERAGSWAERLAGLGEDVVLDLLQMLADDDERVCRNAAVALGRLADAHEVDDPRRAELAAEVVKEYPRLSAAGRQAVLELAVGWARSVPPCPDDMLAALARLLPEVAREDSSALGLELALQVLRRRPRPELLCPARELARGGMRSTEARMRVRSIQLALEPGMELAKDVVPLLSDDDATVRRAAMLAVGPSEEAIYTDNLLAWLHDPDPEVRRLCEVALRGEKRELTEPQIRLARMITDPRWRVRLEVLDHLEELEEGSKLNAGACLRRLSHDASAAVRAAAIRAAVEEGHLDLQDRLDQMAHNDPSPTVSRLAQHYLGRQKSLSPPTGN